MKKIIFLFSLLLSSIASAQNYPVIRLSQGQSEVFYDLNSQQAVQVYCEGQRQPPPKPTIYKCQYKDMDRNVLLKAFYGSVQDMVCEEARQDCQRQSNNCRVWNSGKVSGD